MSEAVTFYTISTGEYKSFTNKLEDDLTVCQKSFSQSSRRDIQYLYQLAPCAFKLVAWLRGQQHMHITISLQYHPSKSFNSYQKANICIMWLFTTIPRLSYCVKHSSVVTFCVKCHVWVNTLKLAFMYNNHVKESRFWHKFLDVTILNRKTIHTVIFNLRQTGLLLNKKGTIH
jgi:hypothetical protein